MATSFKRGREPDVNKALGGLQGNHALTDGKDIGIIVLAGELGCVITPGDSTSDPLHFVRSHGLTVARAAKDNGLVALTTGCFFCSGDNPKRIIGGVGRVGSAIHDFMALRTQHLGDGLLVMESGVITS